MIREKQMHWIYLDHNESYILLTVDKESLDIDWLPHREDYCIQGLLHVNYAQLVFLDLSGN